MGSMLATAQVDTSYARSSDQREPSGTSFFGSFPNGECAYRQTDKGVARQSNELLLYVAGVDVRQRGANGVQADVSIRGGTFDQTLVLVNI